MLYFWNFRHRHMPSYSYIHTKKCTPYNSFQQTWTQHLQGTLTNCPKRCTSRTFPILCPKRVIGIQGKDLFEMVSTQVLFGSLFCNVRSWNSLTEKTFHWHGTSAPHAYFTHAKYHAIALTNLCRVEAPQCSATALYARASCSAFFTSTPFWLYNGMLADSFCFMSVKNCGFPPVKCKQKRRNHPPFGLADWLQLIAPSRKHLRHVYDDSDTRLHFSRNLWKQPPKLDQLF